jgi:hypothetical protein
MHMRMNVFAAAPAHATVGTLARLEYEDVDCQWIWRSAF